MSDASPNTIDRLENSLETRESGSLGSLVKRIREKVAAWFSKKPEESANEGVQKPQILKMTQEDLERLQPSITVLSGELADIDDLKAIIEQVKMPENEEEITKFIKSDIRIIHDLNTAHRNREWLGVPYEQERSRIIAAYMGRYPKQRNLRHGVRINYAPFYSIEDAAKALGLTPSDIQSHVQSGKLRWVDLEDENGVPEKSIRQFQEAVSKAEAEAIAEDARHKVIPMVAKPHPQPKPEVPKGDDSGEDINVA